MTKRSIFAKIFLITFALFSGLVILLHASVYFIFPSTYIESQRQTILKKSEDVYKRQGEKEVKSIMKRIFYDSPLELLFNWSSHLSS